MKWKDYEIAQQKLCDKEGKEWTPANKELKIGLADNVLLDLQPINGLRHRQEHGTTGWYIWSGKEFSEEGEFFKPYCVEHLLTLKPDIIKFLGLPPGHRFLIDNKGYQDIWEDTSLLD